MFRVELTFCGGLPRFLRRCLLTRDRRLLMHAIVQHGYCPRADDPEQQAREVLRRY
jgi:uncharacterized protein with PIN domain